MKRNSMLISALVIVIMSLLLSLASCKTQTVAPPEEDLSQQHADPTSLNVPTDAEVEAAYHKASEAYGWFNMGTMPVTDGQVEVDGMMYQKVDYPGITTMAEFEAYLKTLFTDDVVAQLFANDAANTYPMYRDIDGALYALPGARGADIFKGDESYEVIVKGGDEIDFRVSVEVYDDPETMNVVDTEVFDFMYVDKAQNGEWRFANFENVR